MSTGLDTNILARYYVHDADDSEASAQREAARGLIESGEPLAVAKTVLLELEWVMRGYYRFAPSQVARVFRHLLSLAHIEVEDRAAVEIALSLSESGAALEFADALHHASYRHCARVATFDDRKFARRAQRMGLSPRVFVPKEA